MKWSDILMMRHELLLAVFALMILLADIFISENKKSSFILFAIIFYFLITLAGFLPIRVGELFGGMYHTDKLVILMKNILNIAVLIVLMQSSTWLKKEENREKISEFLFLLVTSVIGMSYLVSSGNFLMFYVSLELSTIPATALAAYEKYKNQSAEAGIKFIFSSALSSGILLFGLSLIFAATGTLYFSDFAAVFTGNPLTVLGLIFFITGIGFKISLVPFHLWTADVYEGSPVNVAAFLSVVSKGTAVFIFTVILFTIFKQVEYTWHTILYVLAILTMTIANLFALRQNNLKRFLAFSSIAQAGFILLGILGPASLGITSVVYFILVYIFTNLGAFGVVSAISNVTSKETIKDYEGLYRTNPLLSLMMMLCLFSLAGIPPVAGFFGKFFLFTSAAGRGYYILILIGVLNATVALYYYLKLVKAMFIDKNDNPIPYFKSDWMTRISLLICLTGVISVGFISWIFEYIKATVENYH